MGCIYKITCSENAKCYIGQTKKNTPNSRYTRHWNDAINRNVQTVLYNAFRKYGRGAFVVDTLCIVSAESLDNMECYFAKQYNSYVWEGGYNAVLCGRGRLPNFNHKQDHRDRMSKLMSGRTVSEETRKKLSAARRGTKNNWSAETRARVAESSRVKSTGAVLSAETRSKISTASTGRKASAETKKKLSEFQRKRYEDPTAYTRKGIPHSNETRKHLSEVHLTRLRENPRANGNQKFTDEQVRHIRLNPYKLTQKQLGEQYGVCFQNISQIQLHKTYKYVV